MIQYLILLTIQYGCHEKERNMKETWDQLSKNSPIKGWGGLSKMSKKMSIIELSWIGQDLFDLVIWHEATH